MAVSLRTFFRVMIVLAVASVPAQADEPVFGFINTTDLLPKGKTEVEQWMTWRHHKAGGYYDQLENRTELSYGVTDAFQLSGYLDPCLPQCGRWDDYTPGAVRRLQCRP